MIIHHEFEQGSGDWLAFRAGKVTASEMGRLVSPLGKIRTGDGPKTMLVEKLAEKWLGGPLPGPEGIFDLEQGKILEERARPQFTLETGLQVAQVGFITDDSGMVGCSPDGLIGTTGGLELKCPRMENHIRYLLDGILPPDYVGQVQGSMRVTGFDHWYFASYRRGMPMFILKVERDDDYQESLTEAIGLFLDGLKSGWDRICKINGGPPPPK